MSEVRLIDANKLITELWQALWKYEDKIEKQFLESDELDIGDWFSHRTFVQNMSDIDRDVVQKQPTVDAVPVRHGKWTMRETAWGTDEAKCSECGFEMLVNEPGNGLRMVNELLYCPHCGAKMDGADGERR